MDHPSEDVALYRLHVVVSQDLQDQVPFPDTPLLGATLLVACDRWPSDLLPVGSEPDFEHAPVVFPGAVQLLRP